MSDPRSVMRAGLALTATGALVWTCAHAVRDLVDAFAVALVYALAWWWDPRAGFLMTLGLLSFGAYCLVDLRRVFLRPRRAPATRTFVYGHPGPFCDN